MLRTSTASNDLVYIKASFQYQNRFITIYFDNDVFVFINPNLSEQRTENWIKAICRSLVAAEHGQDHFHLQEINTASDLLFYIDRVIATATPPATHSLSFVNPYNVAIWPPLQLIVDDKINHSIDISLSHVPSLPQHSEPHFKLIQHAKLIRDFRPEMQKKNKRLVRNAKLQHFSTDFGKPTRVRYQEEDFDAKKAKALFYAVELGELTAQVELAQKQLHDAQQLIESYHPNLLIEKNGEANAEKFQHYAQAIIDEKKLLNLHQFSEKQISHALNYLTIIVADYKDEIKEHYLNYLNREAALYYPKQLVIYAIRDAIQYYYGLLKQSGELPEKKADFNCKFAGIAEIRLGETLKFNRQIEEESYEKIEEMISQTLSYCKSVKGLKSRSLSALKHNLKTLKINIEKVKIIKTIFTFTERSFTWNEEFNFPRREDKLLQAYYEGNRLIDKKLDESLKKIGLCLFKIQTSIDDFLKVHSSIEVLLEEKKRLLVAQEKCTVLDQEMKDILGQTFFHSMEEKEDNAVLAALEESIQFFYQQMHDIYKSLFMPIFKKIAQAIVPVTDLDAYVAMIQVYSRRIRALKTGWMSIKTAIDCVIKLQSLSNNNLSLYNENAVLPKAAQTLLAKISVTLQQMAEDEKKILGSQPNLKQAAISLVQHEQLSEFFIYQEEVEKLNHLNLNFSLSIDKASQLIWIAKKLQNVAVVTKSREGHSIERFVSVWALYNNLQLEEMYTDDDKKNVVKQNLSKINALLEALSGSAQQAIMNESLLESAVKEIVDAVMQAGTDSLAVQQLQKSEETFRTEHIQKLMDVFHLMTTIIQHSFWDKNLSHYNPSNSFSYFETKMLTDKLTYLGVFSEGKEKAERLPGRIKTMRLLINDCADLNDIKKAIYLLTEFLKLAEKPDKKTRPASRDFYNFLKNNIPSLLEGLSGRMEGKQALQLAENILNEAKFFAQDYIHDIPELYLGKQLNY